MIRSIAPATSTGHARGVGISNYDWRLLLRSPANVLVVGSEAQRDRLLDIWRPFLEAPVCQWHTQTAVLPPDARTLLIDNVAAIRTEQQACLLALLRARAPRCLSFSRIPLYDLVTTNHFLEPLYYVLNTVYVVL